ncbi:hypothetical protein ACFL5D_02870 [Candidatus Neomarinimicrobiota bacterium]
MNKNEISFGYIPDETWDVLPFSILTFKLGSGIVEIMLGTWLVIIQLTDYKLN